MQRETSEVLLAGSVAVEVIDDPAGTDTGSVTVKAALPPASVLTGERKPRKVLPSPNPDRSQVGLEKNSRMNPVVFGVLLSVPTIVVELGVEEADVSTG